jgi:2,4-dienoyl-CoA reductase-like NADH-dependent reductase (Old Yellow Enzyme family)
MSSTLFTPTELGKLPLKNRIVMAPLTRSRAIGKRPMTYWKSAMNQFAILYTDRFIPAIAR